MSRLFIGLLLVAAVLAGLLKLGEFGIGPVVITRENEQKIILELGKPRGGATSAGITLRWPLIDEVKVFDRRWLHLSSAPKDIQTLDRERLVVDNYVIWHIADPLLFFKSYPTGMKEAERQIDQKVKAKVREVIGQRKLMQVLRDSRQEIMDEITAKSDSELQRFGIQVLDVRINRTELPTNTEENVFARMRAERNRLARKSRAEGDEEARSLRADADREARVIVADARSKADVERGKGDAKAAGIYAAAYGQDAEFYGFMRSLEAYRKTIGKGTTMVLRPDHPFFRLFQQGGALPALSAAPSGH